MFVCMILYDTVLLPEWKGLPPIGSLLCDVLVFVTFPHDVLGQVWYFIVSIPNLCMALLFDC